MANLVTLEWGAVAQAKRRGHGQATDAHVVAAAVAELELPPDLAGQLRARSDALLAGEPRSFGSPSLAGSARNLLDLMASSGPEPALREWLERAPTEPAAVPPAESPAAQPAVDTRPATGVRPLVSPAPARVQLTAQERAAVMAEAQAELAGLVGLVEVKEHLGQLVNWTLWNRARAEAGLPVPQQSLHMVFTGPPGTGKTTVARIVGRLLHGLGVLEGDNFVEVTRGDLVAEHVGGTAVRTQRVLDQATDGVLFIDEAYTLAPEGGSGMDFGREAIATILAHMENHRDRIVVIAAGYDKEMGQFLDANPGLRSRFATVLDFPRYSNDELVAIFVAMAAEQQVDLDDQVVAAARQRIEHAGGGNARNVRLMMERAIRRMANRAMADGVIEAHELRRMEVSDILGGPDSQARQQLLDRALAELDELVGLEPVKARVRDLMARQAWSRARIAAGMTVPGESLNLVFVGPPGTGKTTVARIVARIYQGLGLLDRGQLVEVTRKDLVAGYVGQSATQTQAALERADGGALFIDEAYTLDDREFGREVVATLTSYLEDHRASVAVIMAGHTEAMRGFLDANPGLRSRMGTTIEFVDYRPEELLAIFERMAARNHLTLGPGVREAVSGLLGAGVASGHAGNARLVRNTLSEAIGRMATRASKDGAITAEELKVLTVDDLPAALPAPARIGFN